MLATDGLSEDSTEIDVVEVEYVVRKHRRQKYRCRCSDCQQIDTDNNGTERELRGPVIGRKNHYGSRSDKGMRAAAVYYSLLETYQRLGVDSRAYLGAARARLAGRECEVYNSDVPRRLRLLKISESPTTTRLSSSGGCSSPDRARYGSDGTSPKRCVRSERWKSGLTQPRLDGPLFRAMDRWGNLWSRPLCAKTVSRLVKRAADAAGLGPADWWSSSLG